MKFYITLILVLCSISIVSAARDIPFRYDNTLAAQGFSSPIASISINGEQGLFLIDSGASVNVISKWFAEKAKIKIFGQSVVAGTSGGTGKSSMSEVDFLVNTRGRKVSFKDQFAVIVTLPEVFRENGLAGIISPQQLLSEKETGVLNLSENPSLKIYKDIPKFKRPVHRLNAVLSEGPKGQKTVLFTIHADVSGIKTNFIVDTGADGAGIGAKTSAGQKLLSQSVSTNERIGGINGTSEEVRIVSKTTVKLLGRDFEMKIRLQPISDKMPAEGMLGMQFLKNCSLILSSTSGSILCP